MSRVGMRIVLFVVCCLFMSLVAMAEPTYNDHGDLIRPNSERFSGTIESLGPESNGVISIVVINDTNYKVDGETIYRNIDGGKSSLSRLKIGMLVDFYAIEQLVTNLSVSANPDDNGDGEHNDQPLPEPDQSDIWQDGGVWKN
jgi:hypothetical protein